MSQIKYYVTKWWQTLGILEGKGPVSKGGNISYVHCRATVAALGTNAFETLDEAVADVRKRAAARVKSLRKELKRVEEMAKGKEISHP